MKGPCRLANYLSMLHGCFCEIPYDAHLCCDYRAFAARPCCLNASRNTGKTRILLSAHRFRCERE